MSDLYPLKFNPIMKSPLWGGQKLQNILHKPPVEGGISGESWEISGVKDNISTVAQGPLKGKSLTELINQFGGELLGEHVYKKYGSSFPLLIKFIDANQDLSIQVHPDDELAKSRHNSFGKTEMWYVVNAEEGATLISGFNKPTDKTEYLKYFEGGKLMELLNKEVVATDDVFFLPAGRVHTIGKGLLIAEIQQTSNITYRIYDFDRVDQQGNKRELHVEEAVDAIDYNFYENYRTNYKKPGKFSRLVECNYFITNRLIVDQEYHAEYDSLDSFKIIMVLSGEGAIKTIDGDYRYNTGETFLIPANIKELDITPSVSSKILEVYLP